MQANKSKKVKAQEDSLKRHKLQMRAMVLTIIGLIVMLAYGLYENYREEELKNIIREYAPTGSLVYGADDSAPPLRYVDTDGEYKGLVIDYMQLISVELGIEIKCKPYEWEKGINAISEGETDLIDLFKSSDRAKSMVFSDPIYTLRTILVTRAGSNLGLKDIPKMRIATQKGDYANGYLSANYPSCEQVYVYDVGKGLELLVNGEVDAVIGDEPVLTWYASKKGIQDKIKNIKTSLYEEEVVVGVNKNKPELLKPLNDAIAKVRSRGQLEKLQQKWFGISTPLMSPKNSVGDTVTYAIIILFIIIGAVAVSLMQNRILRSQVKLRTEQLEISRNELESMINQLPEGIFILEPDLSIRTCNTSAGKLLGKSFLNLSGESSDLLLKEICGDEYDELYRRCFEEKRDYEKKLRYKDRSYMVRGTTMKNDDGSVSNIILSINDITLEEIKTGELLQSSKMMAVGQLAAGMAHELRNPLGIIRNHCYFLRAAEPTEEELRLSIDEIESNVSRAGNIIDNVMNFWRISKGTNERIKLKAFLREIIKLNGSIIKKRGIDCDLTGDDDIEIVSVAEALKHIMINLIQNAIDAVKDNTGKLEITLGECEDDVVITVSDNGAGIEEKNLEQLFNPFFTTKAPKGTGLGLFIAYTETQNIGGTIKVQSKIGKGTTFTIVIPKNPKIKES